MSEANQAHGHNKPETKIAGASSTTTVLKNTAKTVAACGAGYIAGKGVLALAKAGVGLVRGSKKEVAKGAAGFVATGLKLVRTATK